VDLYDDVITTASSRRDSESDRGEGDGPTATAGTVNNNSNNSGTPKGASNAVKMELAAGGRENSTPLRRHQVYVGNLTWVLVQHVHFVGFVRLLVLTLCRLFPLAVDVGQEY